jgi:hypothetical protein
MLLERLFHMAGLTKQVSDADSRHGHDRMVRTEPALPEVERGVVILARLIVVPGFPLELAQVVEDARIGSEVGHLFQNRKRDEEMFSRLDSVAVLLKVRRAQVVVVERHLRMLLAEDVLQGCDRFELGATRLGRQPCVRQ